MSNNNKIEAFKNITVYTASDFPFGGAPENFVRQMALGIYECGAGIRIVRLRGRIYGGENNTTIHCSNFIFTKRSKNELLKFGELLLIIFYTPLHILIDKLRNKTDAIILYGIEYSYYCILFLIIAKLFKIKIFRIITDYYEQKSIVPVWWKQPKVFFYNLQFKYFDKSMDGLIVLSNYLKKQAIKNKVVPNRILLLPHFIDLSTPIFQSPKDNSYIKIGFFGSATKERGFFDLIEAFRILNQKYGNMILIISGKLPDVIISEIQPILNELGNHLQFTGFISTEALKQMQQSCDILVNPPQNSIGSQAAFPTKFGEYFATAKPVVSTKTGDIINYFTNKKELVLVEPSSPPALADGIEFLIKNEIEANRIGLNGYNWARANLDYLTNANKLLSFISNS